MATDGACNCARAAVATSVLAAAMTVAVLFGSSVDGASAVGAAALAPARAAEVAASVEPAVVDVVATLGDRGEVSFGTGIVLTSDGLVMTNDHVIDGATDVRVTDVGNRISYGAVVVGYDRSDDVAVVHMLGASGLATARLASAPPRSPEPVVAIGNARGRGGTPAAWPGAITARRLSVTIADGDRSEHLVGMIEADTPIVAGASGGPLVDAAGEVVGMDTAVSGSGRTAFAIPIAAARQIVDEIVNAAQRPTRPTGRR
ncbi:MAG TPA: trypsin-like peptidase domain-containing protein [Acidimicrobiales bacterium]|nr:trypsin-like peptidase domain-containing protein [Acidimicrobiales bacterium]